MSYDPIQQTTAATGAEIDAGLQEYMRSVFNIMAMGLLVTGLSAWATASIDTLKYLIFGTPLGIVAALAPFGFIWAMRRGQMNGQSAAKLRTTFLIFSGVMGLSMAWVFISFAKADVARAFFITAGTFASMSLYGYTAKKDLTGMGSFAMMGLIGLVIASVVNMFLQSTGVQFVISVAGVLIFTGLTAFEVQRLKETYSYGQGMQDQNARLAVSGALNLYLNFINLFQMILQLTGGGNRR